MRILAAAPGFARTVFWVPLVFITAATCQNPPASHVIIPNPTPRPPDLKQQYGDDSKDGKKQKELSIQNQLRAREIWLESNQILLLAQQLQQEVSGKKSMAADAVKVGQIEKLARSVKEKQTANQAISASSADRETESAKILPPEQGRQSEIQTNTKRLYELSAQLRAEVGRTYKESLSLNVLRKAEEVEKLARSLKAEMNEEAATAKRKK
jgi:hypothetical protein